MATPPLPASRNYLSSDVEIKGTITFADHLTFDGHMEGDIMSAGTLVVGENASIEGDISAGKVAVHGAVKGNVVAEDRCELNGDSELIGDLEAPYLVMEEGATFIGRSKVSPRAEERRANDAVKP